MNFRHIFTYLGATHDMKIALASDHAGYAEKEHLKPLLDELGVEYEDLGTVSETSVDYPDYARVVGERVARLGAREVRERRRRHSRSRLVDDRLYYRANREKGAHDQRVELAAALAVRVRVSGRGAGR